MRALQQRRQLALLRLQVRVATNVLLVDEDVRDGSLVGDLLQSVLNRRAVVYTEDLVSTDLLTSLVLTSSCFLTM